MRVKTGIDKMQLISMIDISSSKYYYWLKHKGEPLRHNGNMPRSHYLLPEEREKIITYKKLHPELGYRKLTWQMVDENIVYVSPPTVYRVLRKAHLNTMFTREGGAKHPKGFVQPEKPHEQWHIDISYINVFGTFMFLISVLDGYSRYILSWDLRTTMETFDVEMVLQKALEEYRNENPRVITDNGGQFISKEFKNYLRFVGIKHSRTRVNHPQSNGKIERFHKSIKTECIRIEPITSKDVAKKRIGEYIYNYNNRRLHAALNYLRPVDYLKGSPEALLEERSRKLTLGRVLRKQKRKKVA